MGVPDQRAIWHPCQPGTVGLHEGDLPSGGPQVRLDGVRRPEPWARGPAAHARSGEQQDWFHSTEIIAELVVACLGIYLFVVHLFTSDNTFIPPRIFRDVNFAAGFLIMFAIGMILLSSMALLPPYLQNLGGYSITSTGLLMAPRGLGTMLAMVVAGRLTSRVDPRLLMFAGILMICASMWSMVGWTPDVDAWSLALTTFTQGVGLGFGC